MISGFLQREKKNALNKGDILFILQSTNLVLKYWNNINCPICILINVDLAFGTLLLRPFFNR